MTDKEIGTMKDKKEKETYAYCASYNYVATGYKDDLESQGSNFLYFMAGDFGEAMDKALLSFQAYEKFRTAPDMLYAGLHYHLKEVVLDRVRI